MRPGPHSAPPARPRRPFVFGAERDSAMARELLGAGHPLVRVLEACETVLQALAAVVGLQAVGVVLVWEGDPFGLSLAIAGAVAEVALAMRIALVLASRRETCLTMIIEGEPRLPLAALERQRRRVGDPRHRRLFAQSLEELAAIAERPRARRTQPRPLFDVLVVRAVVPQLREIARLLRSESPALRGVALVERLMTSGTSALYAADDESLRQELGRARYLLNLQTERPGLPTTSQARGAPVNRHAGPPSGQPRFP
jgi:hypothetical protein